MRQTSFGSYIRSLRYQSGMTQAELADRVGVTDKAVSKWERDISWPDIAIFPKLADLLGVTLGDLLRASMIEGQPSRLMQIFQMSHDIRTPLHMILGCVDMAKAHTDDYEQLMRYLDSIRIAGEYLLRMVERAMQTTGQDGTCGDPGPGRFGGSCIDKPCNADKPEYADESGNADKPEYADESGNADKPEYADKPEAAGGAGYTGAEGNDGRGAGTEDGLEDLEQFLKRRARMPEERVVENCDFSGRRFLVAEDMELNREIAAEILKSTGAAVEFAEDGQVCVEMVENAPPGYYDLILMDIRMPRMDGVEATRRIRQLADPEKAAIPVIAMTANVYERDRKLAYDAGMNDFVEKPVFTDRLFRAIQSCL